MSVFIESSKTDKYRDGAWTLISRTGTFLCPVMNLERYLQWAGILCDSDVFLFSRLHPAGDVLWVFVEPGNVVP